MVDSIILFIQNEVPDWAKVIYALGIIGQTLVCLIGFPEIFSGRCLWENKQWSFAKVITFVFLFLCPGAIALSVFANTKWAPKGFDEHFFDRIHEILFHENIIYFSPVVLLIGVFFL